MSSTPPVPCRGWGDSGTRPGPSRQGFVPSGSEHRPAKGTPALNRRGALGVRGGPRVWACGPVSRPSLVPGQGSHGAGAACSGPVCRGRGAGLSLLLLFHRAGEARGLLGPPLGRRERGGGAQGHAPAQLPGWVAQGQLWTRCTRSRGALGTSPDEPLEPAARRLLCVMCPADVADSAVLVTARAALGAGRGGGTRVLRSSSPRLEKTLS